MKYFEKKAFRPKDYTGIALGATVGGLAGYGSSKKGKELPSTLAGVLYGGVVGSIGHSIVSNLRHASKISKRPEIARDFDNFADPIIRKSQKAMDKLRKQENRIKSHVSEKSQMKYEDVLKFMNKKAQYKQWNPDWSLSENLAGGATIGAIAGFTGSTMTSSSIVNKLIKKKLLTPEVANNLKRNPAAYAILGGLIGGGMGLGKYVTERKDYTA